MIRAESAAPPDEPPELPDELSDEEQHTVEDAAEKERKRKEEEERWKREGTDLLRDCIGDSMVWLSLCDLIGYILT